MHGTSAESPWTAAEARVAMVDMLKPRSTHEGGPTATRRRSSAGVAR
jgi:hypothetical protein